MGHSRLTVDRAYTRHRNRNPHQIRIPIKTEALQKIRALTPIPLQHRPQPARHNSRVPIHQPRSPAQQLEVICKMLLAFASQVLIYRPREEEDDHDGGRDPHGAVEVGVALEDVEEVCARVQGRGATT